MKRLKKNPHAELIAWANGHRDDSPRSDKCEDCPPEGWPTDATRCDECPCLPLEAGEKL